MFTAKQNGTEQRLPSNWVSDIDTALFDQAGQRVFRRMLNARKQSKKIAGHLGYGRVGTL